MSAGLHAASAVLDLALRRFGGVARQGELRLVDRRRASPRTSSARSPRRRPPRRPTCSATRPLRATPRRRRRRRCRSRPACRRSSSASRTSARGKRAPPPPCRRAAAAGTRRAAGSTPAARRDEAREGRAEGRGGGDGAAPQKIARRALKARNSSIGSMFENISDPSIGAAPRVLRGRGERRVGGRRARAAAGGARAAPRRARRRAARRPSARGCARARPGRRAPASIGTARSRRWRRRERRVMRRRSSDRSCPPAASLSRRARRRSARASFSRVASNFSGACSPPRTPYSRVIAALCWRVRDRRSAAPRRGQSILARLGQLRRESTARSFGGWRTSCSVIARALALEQRHANCAGAGATSSTRCGLHL